jgi:methyl-accepting chemotaxis protein
MFNLYSNTTRILAAFFAAALLFLLALTFSLKGLDDAVGDFRTLQQHENVRMDALHAMFGRGLLGGFAVRNKIFDPTLTESRPVVVETGKSFVALLAQVRALTHPQDRAALATLDDIANRWQIVQRTRVRALEWVEQGQPDAAHQLLAAQEIMEWKAIRKALDGLIADQQKAVEAMGDQVLADAAGVRMRSIVVALVSLIAGIALMSWVMRGLSRALCNVVRSMREIAEGRGDLTRRLAATGRDETAELAGAFNAFVEKIQRLMQQVVGATAQLASAAGQMTLASEASLKGVERQQQETDQVVTAITEMSAAIQEVARSTGQTAAMAQEADGAAQDGRHTVEDAINMVRATAREVQSAADAIAALERESESIGAVLDVIQGISEQTNLLALNAAIEAARAGEQGRGFAVVADEVRTLAVRTRESTQEIKEMIERLQAKARQSVSIMERGRSQAEATVTKSQATDAALNSIAGRVSTISEMTTQVASATEEQSAVAEDISKNIHSIRLIADDVFQSARQLAEASGNLAQLAGELQSIEDNFRV